MLKNIFTEEVSQQLIERINKLNENTKPLWGKMSVSQMLAHCCVTYEYVYKKKYPKPNFVMSFFLKAFVKDMVVSDRKYKKGERTGPDFIIKSDKNFEVEKKRLVDYIIKTQQLGEAYFDGKESHSFGRLTKKEWSNMFYKHLDHHLSQFGV